jgi:hypothetical protein
MADTNFGTDDQEPEAGADELQTEQAPGGQTDTPEEPGEDALLDKDGTVAPDPTDPNYKYWQGAYTQTRQRDRERYGKLEGEHKQFGDVLRQFYQSDEYALQVLRQRFPQLATKLSLDGTPASEAGTPTGGSTSRVVQLLESKLGSDLAFLAPRLGPVLEEVIRASLTEAITPLHRQTEERAALDRKREEDRLLTEMDSQYPGWEPRYGSKMQDLDAFLGSDQLTHPVYGNRYQLLYKLLNGDQARIDATRAMNHAAHSRLTTGRAGRESQPNIDEQVLKAKSNTEAFMLAAEAAARELGRRG